MLLVRRPTKSLKTGAALILSIENRALIVEYFLKAGGVNIQYSTINIQRRKGSAF